MTAQKRRLRARQMLGKYRIERRLADGGRATVFQAYDTIHGVKVALKIPEQEVLDEDFLAALARQGRLERPTTGLKVHGLHC